MSDETLLRLVHNGLMVAGHEMGPVGDHWPAINAISSGVTREFSELERLQAVNGELEFHIANTLREIEETTRDCPAADRAAIDGYLKQRWEEFYAIFEPVDADLEPDSAYLFAEDEELPSKNICAAVQILKNMGGVA